ncbi:hypothetical protein Tco_0454209 [Tanacetum coccineum]
MSANSRSIFDGMMVYIKRETKIVLEFAANLHNLGVQFIDRTNDRKLFISELEGVSTSLMSNNCCQFPHQDPRLQSKKSFLDSSFTLDSTEEADNVKILQSCNGLLLCSGSGRPVFNYIYNPSINQYRKLPHLDCSLDNSPYYRSAGLRMAFDPTKSPHYKLVDARRTSCYIDIQIYSLETDN